MKESQIISNLAAARAFELAAKLWKALGLSNVSFEDYPDPIKKLNMVEALERTAKTLRERVK